MSDNELVEIKQESALQVFTQAGGIDPYLDIIQKEVEAFVPGDVQVKKERDRIASMAYKLAKTGSYLESVGKDLADEAKALPKKIDAARKTFKDTIAKWKEEVRAPLTAWEAAEEAWVQRITQLIEAWQAIAQDHGQHESGAIRTRLSEMKAVAVTEEAFQEYTAAVAQAKDAAVTALERHLEAALKREAEAKELTELRRQAEERAQKDRDAKIAEDARAEAERAATAQREALERKAEDDRKAAAKREADLKAEAEHAQRQKEEAEQRALKAEADAKVRAVKEAADRVAAEAAAAEKRESSKRHAGKIHSAAMEAMVAGGMDAAQAKLAVELIAKRLIPAISIAY